MTSPWQRSFKLTIFICPPQQWHSSGSSAADCCVSTAERSKPECGQHRIWPAVSRSIWPSWTNSSKTLSCQELADAKGA